MRPSLGLGLIIVRVALALKGAAGGKPDLCAMEHPWTHGARRAFSNPVTCRTNQGVPALLSRVRSASSWSA